ncbi:HalOD1 output domain-containing protein [Halosolutus gelatinilyticus]|uniref:HalOD1 output domain-containing protein n=1 Tax=Halosolutus gelatinilyticus TaxID=2931975 RepID=UPI001FF602CC|nr:HalOD1 output domain-containing protein [Halosolutus gelatinilyticus]
MIVHPLTADAREPDSVTGTIVSAVSDAEDCDPLSLPPLWDVIDSEALDELFAPTRTGRHRAGSVRFDYAGYEVTVTVDADTTGNVSLEALSDRDRADENRYAKRDE